MTAAIVSMTNEERAIVVRAIAVAALRAVMHEVEQENDAHDELRRAE